MAMRKRRIEGSTPRGRSALAPTANQCLSAAALSTALWAAVVNGLYRQPGCSFLLPFPPSQARFLLEPALHVRGHSACRKGRLAAPRLFLWRPRLGAARCWNGLEGHSLEGVGDPDSAFMGFLLFFSPVWTPS